MTNEEIIALLLRFRSWNQGETTELSKSEWRAMFDEGMVGLMGGLTRKGSIACEKAKRAQEAVLFGF